MVPPSATTRFSDARKFFIRARGRDSDPPKAHRNVGDVNFPGENMTRARNSLGTMQG